MTFVVTEVERLTVATLGKQHTGFFETFANRRNPERQAALVDAELR